MRLHWLPSVSVELQMETPIRMSPSFLAEEEEPPEEAVELEADWLVLEEPDDPVEELSPPPFLEQPVNDRPKTASDNKIPKIFFINPPD
jgi:hypothetical protein